MGFSSDLILGRESETLIKDILLKSGWTLISHAPKTSAEPYDLHMKTPEGVDLKIEVKNETRYAASKNAFVETSCSDKPSGIFGTDADVMIHHFGDKFRIHNTKLTRWYIYIEDYPEVRCGDGYRVLGTLLPRSIQNKFMKECDECSLSTAIMSVL